MIPASATWRGLRPSASRRVGDTMDMKERTIEQEAEHRQLEAEALVEAQRDRDMFERDAPDNRGPKK